MSRARSRLVIGLLLAVIAVAVGVYVTSTTDTSPRIAIGGEAADAFGPDGAIDAGVHRGIFSPDGSLVAAINANGVGVLRHGHVQLVTPAESAAVDAAWMPDSRSLLIAEGPATMQQLTVLTLDGAVKGVARLDEPFAVGFGFGLAVDRRGARAVAVREARDPIGGHRRHDLVLIELTSGHVSVLTDTEDADEEMPVFLDDDRLVYASATGTDVAVMERTLSSGQTRQISRASEVAEPVGVVLGVQPVYATTADDGVVAVWVVLQSGRRARIGKLAKWTNVWSVSPRGTAAIVSSAPPHTRNGPYATRFVRAVTLTAPT
ncbi:MAG TPA: hypothetical protein VFB78_17420 [Acidimicrobiales bacterium]|nr:hypothetical protein [Acidimicrobiales bacterium]